jgi:pantoate--beta-alanine ligase
MYQPGFATRIEVAGAAEGLESDFRPHFFGGVATVVAKLLTQVGPDVAIFGEKDYQQLAVVRQLVRDLDLPVTIVGAPTIREPDGLAMSSRNAYLTAQERKIAPSLNAAMRQLAATVKAGSDIAAAASEAREAVLAAGFGKVDYIEVRDAVTLKPVAAGHRGELRILAAAWLGKTRLIDNIGV